MIKQQRDELQIRLKDKEQQYKQLYEQRQDGLKKEAQQFGLQILEQNKDLESGKNLKKEKDELNEAQNQIERMNEQIDQLKTETIDLQHELQITQENLEIQKQELNKNQQTAKDEEDLKIKAEEQRWQLQGEYEVLILENARLKQTLGEERTQQEDQRIREEKRLNDERINKIELDKRDSDERIRLFEQRLKEADDRIQQLERPCSVCKQIGLQLNQPLIGSKDQKTKIKEQSEVLSIIISQTYQLDDDDEGKKRTIVSGIAEGLLQILQNYPLREITENNSKAYRHLAYTSDENKRLLYQKDPLPVMIRLLDHTESKIVNHAIVTICNFLYSEVDQQENKIHPHFQDLNKCDGINRMYQLFKKGPYKYSRDRAAIAIGLVLRSQEINVPVPAKQKGNANASMKQEVIAHLKMLMLDDPEQWIKDAAKDALKGLAKNEANRVEISKGGFECPE
ncbi:MAG: hypothetical protein EZS28_011602 [Streblomastix strix]|uniref:Uncharacterized protein n=1 Tax=Streblomastix strix TaxID=222440 RepID=A0A5J4WD65_9EUKA|nr:MAG: hypothetical protein EZS28_011602 [Streblomastix strix]